MNDTLVFYSDVDPYEAWRAAILELMPELSIKRHDQITALDKVRYALVWKPPLGFFLQFSHLELIINLGAGADSLLARNDLPPVPVARICDTNMARMMAGYVLFATLRYARDIPALEQARREHRWHYIHPREASQISLGILGLGELGAYAAKELARQGFHVTGWSRSPKTVDGINTVSGPDALQDVLASSEILVVLLPLTPETRGLLDARRLGMLPRGAKLINVGRGAIIDEAALIDNLNSGHLGGATLDVFVNSPLAPSDPLWAAPNLMITPHLASTALPNSAAPQIVENIRNVRDGRAIRNRVDTQRGY
jgi:glyoxylate/hydroxypyruvate reductase A